MSDSRDPIRAAFDDDACAIVERLRRADAAIEPPEGLLARIDGAIAARSRHQRRLGALGVLGVGAAAAAVGAALTAWWVAGGGGAVRAPAPRVGTTPPTVATVADPSPVRTHVRFAPDSPLFERAVESTRPNISIHFIYRSAAPAAPATPGEDDAQRPSSLHLPLPLPPPRPQAWQGAPA